MSQFLPTNFFFLFFFSCYYEHYPKYMIASTSFQQQKGFFGYRWKHTIKPLVLPLDVVANELHRTKNYKECHETSKTGDTFAMESCCPHTRHGSSCYLPHIKLSASYQLLTDLGTELHIVISCLQGSEKWKQDMIGSAERKMTFIRRKNKLWNIYVHFL